ncbi:MAG: exopolyphosphatase [Deltaproteobacteria bacterium HGW-Deltaproteobacteria-9]|nr:MAG: exopolyphosphatase [Deltaproteobacteria bacterium HGW-Deltaproteobacteria-9]
MSTKDPRRKDKVIIANCSGYFGDRLSAAKEMVQGGPIDILTGDYLAELTMAILFGQKMRKPETGYVPTFLKQMEQVMGECLDRGIRVVSNAGGLNPQGMAKELQKIADALGLHPKIACIEGDDLMARLADLQEKGEAFIHLDKGISLKDAGAMPISANAYMGGWGVTEALDQGADIVVGGRLADASVVMGPAAWWFGWQRKDWDKLASAAVAGHIIECGAQATGGNYSFIEEVPSFLKVGYPIAEIFADGSFVITKHPGTGGLVSVDTVKAQLLYEVRGPKYLTPDVSARFDTIEISQEGPDRTKITGVKGEPPPETTKVCINNAGNYRNSMTIVLTGLDIEKKAKIFEDALFDSLGGRGKFAVEDVQLIRSDKEDPQTNDEAFAYLRVSVMDPDAKKVGKFSAKIVELGLANIPGFTATAPPTKGGPAIIHWPTLISTKYIQQKVMIGDRVELVDSVLPDSTAIVPVAKEMVIPPVPAGKMIAMPLGRVFATRSGDKGGNANLGVWAKTPEAFAFLREFLTTDKLKELLRDMSGFEMERYEFPNLLAVNFYIKGVLGEGVAASMRSDPQAKTLGEYLRAKVIAIPEAIAGRAKG